jgi:excisionase family DNA binding protein
LLARAKSVGCGVFLYAEQDENNELLELPALSVAQAAELLGIGTTQAYFSVEKGDIPSVRLSGRGRGGRGRIVVPTAGLKKMLGMVG